jgi:hypothetical protein
MQTWWIFNKCSYYSVSADLADSQRGLKVFSTCRPGGFSMRAQFQVIIHKVQDPGDCTAHCIHWAMGIWIGAPSGARDISLLEVHASTGANITSCQVGTTADLSPASTRTAHDSNAYGYTSIPLYVFRAWCLFKHQKLEFQGILLHCGHFSCCFYMFHKKRKNMERLSHLCDYTEDKTQFKDFIEIFRSTQSNRRKLKTYILGRTHMLAIWQEQTTRSSGLLCHTRLHYSQIMFPSIPRSLFGLSHINNTWEEPREKTMLKQPIFKLGLLPTPRQRETNFKSPLSNLKKISKQQWSSSATQYNGQVGTQQEHIDILTTLDCPIQIFFLK